MASRFDMSCYKPTSDWWCGNYEGNMVRCMLSMAEPTGERWVVGVWGNDDCGFTRDFINDYASALETYHTILRCKDVTFDFVKSIGLEAF
jgi:hypothetical protein